MQNDKKVVISSPVYMAICAAFFFINSYKECIQCYLLSKTALNIEIILEK